MREPDACERNAALDREGWRDGVKERQLALERAGAKPAQALVMALEERLTDEYAENLRLWDQADEIARLVVMLSAFLRDTGGKRDD